MAAAAAASAKGSKELNAGNAFHASVAEPFRNRAVYIGDTIASDASGAVIQLVAVHLRAGMRCSGCEGRSACCIACSLQDIAVWSLLWPLMSSERMLS